IRTAVSAGRADSVAYTAPAMSRACSASDVAPTPSSVFFWDLRFVSRSLSSTRPPVSWGRLATALRHKTRLDDEKFPQGVSWHEPARGPDRGLTRRRASTDGRRGAS